MPACRAVSRSIGVLFLVTASLAAAAEGEPEVAPAPPEPAAAAPAAAPTVAAKPGAAYGHDAAHYSTIWNKRRQAINKGDFVQADRLLEELVTSKQRAGWPDIFAYAESVAWESRALGVAGDWKRALELGKASVELGPHRLNSHLAVASAKWAQGDWQGSLQELRAGIHLVLSEPPYLMARAGNFVLAVLGGLVVAALAYAFASLYRHLTPLFHDLGHLLPVGSLWWQYALLLVAVVFWPVLFRFGAVWTIAWWLLLLVPYQRHERWATAAVLFALLLATLALPAMTSFLAYPRSHSEALYLVGRDMNADDAAAQLERDETPTAETLLARGLRARWLGDGKQSAELIEKAREGGLDSADVQVALGNAYFLAGDAGKAERLYLDLVGTQPRNPLAVFNLSQLRAATGDAAGAADARRRATELDPGNVARWVDIASRTGVPMMEPTVPHRLLKTSFEAGHEHSRATEQLWRALGGIMPRMGVVVMLAISFVWAVAMSVLQMTGGSLGTWAGACLRCGDAACRRCAPTLQNVERCVVCAQAAADETLNNPQDGAGQQLRIRKEIDSHRYHSRLLQTQRVFNWVLAGNGQLLRGSPWRGLLFVFLFVTLILAICMGAGLIPEPLPAYHGFSGLFMVAQAVLLVLVYIVAIIDGRHEES